MKKIILLILALVLILSLAACGIGGSTGTGSNSAGGNTPTASSNTGGDSGNQNTSTPAATNSGGDSNNAFADNTGWPDTWPSDIPKASGTVDYFAGDGIAASDGGITVFMKVFTKDDYTNYVNTLKGKGFTVDNEQTDPDSNSIVAELSNAKYTLHVMQIGKDTTGTVYAVGK